MGPIDPTVSNAFNPISPQTQQPVGISVEDVKAYVSFIKDSVGIRHEDELVKAVEILANKVHPLALGNVERFISQSRMIARKILLTHMEEESRHKIDELIETLASKLYFHGHPINRKEARTELGLKVLAKVPAALETAMWKLYLDFEEELQNTTVFDPLAEIFNLTPDPVPNPAGPQVPSIIPLGTNKTLSSTLAFVESATLSSFYSVTHRFVVAGAGAQGEPLVRNETLKQGWTHHSAPKSAPRSPTRKRARRGAR